ncbi:MAG: hypothetical protein P1P82_06355 [Bacteroidales bacterium]|nr:hypothetical protein [Bacteroidales bacterium]MDT8430432.1 hypothetical protein [Bacteroidales bacterium]
MNKTDKQILLEIMAGAFRESDRLRPILRKGNTEKRLKIMAAYAYDLAFKFNGVYLSEDKTTAIVYWQQSKYKRSVKDYLKYAVMFLRTLKLHKLLETARREKYVESRRPDLDDYIYVWLLGKDPETNSIRGLADIRDHLNDLARSLNIPILIETTVEKLLKLYRYVGFEVYDEFFDETIGMPVYFLRKDPPE